MNVRVFGEVILNFGNWRARRNDNGGPMKWLGKQGLCDRFGRDFARN